LGTGAFLGLLPFSANIARHASRLPPLLLPVHRFSQPPDRNDVCDNLQVYSTLQALLGFGLQRSQPIRSGTVPSPWLLRRHPALHGFLPDVACGSRPPGRRATTLATTLQHPAPDRLLNGWLPSWAWTDLEALIPDGPASSRQRVSPPQRKCASPDLGSFRVFLPGGPGPESPPPCGVLPPLGFFCHRRWPLRKRSTFPPGVSAFWFELPLRTLGYRGY
jgi:hypothetical protein